MAFLACRRHGDALRCYEAAGDASMAFSLLLRASPPQGGAAVRRLATSLVDTLSGQGRHEEAGDVAATYLRDALVAARCYAAGAFTPDVAADAFSSTRHAVVRGCMSCALCLAVGLAEWSLWHEASVWW